MTEETENHAPRADTAQPSRLMAVLRAYRFYWLTPIVLGLALLVLMVAFADSETLGRFSYFNF